MPRLYVLSGPDIGKSFEVADGAALGRGAECAVRFHDPSVSRHHARLERAGGGWRIVDTGSRNGVSLAGKRVAGAPLTDGDEFQVGEVVVRFRVEGVVPGSSSPRSSSSGAGVSQVAHGLEEISLDEDSSPASGARTGAAPPSSAQATGRASEALDRTVLSAPRPGNLLQRGQRVLQYQRILDRPGFFAADLAQQPLWVRLGAGLLAIALFAGLFVLAFKGTAYLKGRASHGAPDVEEPASR